MIRLRDYQADAIEELRRRMRAGQRRIMLCAPTGAGKTVCAAEMLRAAAEKGHRALFLADLTALVAQTSRRLHEAGLDHGVIMGDHPARDWESVQVASAQTLERREWWQNGRDGDYGLLIVDEAHTMRRATMEWIRKTGVPTIGLSATPFARGLGKHYQSVVNIRSTNSLIDDGWLCRLEKYAATPIDMTGAKTNSSGEWKTAEAERRAMPVVGDVVRDWLEHTRRHFGGPVPSIVFSASVAHGTELARRFADHGHTFEQISYKDRDNMERQAKLRRLKDGEIDGLISCEALAKGFDEPSIRCVSMARPYRKSLHSVIQALGRGMRSDTEKEYCLLLDHSGNYLRFGGQIEVFWEHGISALDTGEQKRHKAQPTDAEKEPRQCKSCGYILADCDVDSCPACGKEFPPPRSRVEEKAGIMRKLGGGDDTRSLSQRFGDIWPQICAIAAQREYERSGEWDKAKALRWASVQHKALTGAWPRDRKMEYAPHVHPGLRALVKENFRKWQKQQYAIRNSMGRKKRRAGGS